MPPFPPLPGAPMMGAPSLPPMGGPQLPGAPPMRGASLPGGPPMGGVPGQAAGLDPRSQLTRDALIQLLRGQVTAEPAGSVAPRPFVPPADQHGTKRSVV